MSILSLFFIITILQTGADIQQSKITKAKQVASIEIVKDSLDSWISNWGLSCRIPERIIESEKKFFNKPTKDYTYLLEYVLFDEDDDDEDPFYRYLSGGKLYIFADGKLKKCLGFFHMTDYVFNNHILMMEVRPIYYSSVNKRKIERFYNSYQPECFIESGRINKLSCVDCNGVLRICELTLKHHHCKLGQTRYCWLYL